MRVDIKTNFPEVQRWITDVGKQARFATMVAINATARDVQSALKTELPRIFDRPTPYIVTSIRVTSWARRDNLEAVIEPKYLGGKGVDPASVLQAEIYGGQRRLKRSEVALQRAGILPAGYVTVPGQACPLDQYGNVKGSFIVQLLSYFAAFGEQGYRANMTAKRKAKLARRGVSAAGFKTIGGVEYFVSYGKSSGTKLYGAGGSVLSFGRQQHLHPGIWSRSGTHGSNVKPIIMFVKSARYKPRFDFEGIGQKVVDQRFERNFDIAFDEALRTAR